MKYNKLVRDNIPDIIAKKGGKAVTHIAGDAEYWLKLKEKLLEEVGEFQDAENAEEIADVLQVIDAICEAKGWSKIEVEDLKAKKEQVRGGFKKKIILDEA